MSSICAHFCIESVVVPVREFAFSVPILHTRSLLDGVGVVGVAGVAGVTGVAGITVVTVVTGVAGVAGVTGVAGVVDVRGVAGVVDVAGIACTAGTADGRVFTCRGDGQGRIGFNRVWGWRLTIAP